MSVFARLAGLLLIGLARLLTGAYANWVGCRPDPKQRLYFANHSSHGDFILIWTVQYMAREQQRSGSR